MQKTALLFVILLLGPFLFAFSEDEKIAITTYYPSPYGSYKQLHANQLGVGAGYQGAAIPSDGLIVEGNVSIGTPTPAGSNKLTVAGNSVFNGTTSVNGTFMVNGVKGAGAYFGVPFSTLNGLHDKCFGHATDDIAPCMAACNRYCGGQGYHGGAIVEWNGIDHVGGCICS